MSLPRRPKTRSDLRPHEGVWSAAPRPLRRTQRPLPKGWRPFLAFPFIYDSLCKFGKVSPPRWLMEATVISLLFGFVTLAVVWILWNVGEALALRTTEDDWAFSDAPEGLVEHPMEVLLCDAHGPYGSDRGFVWIEDGLLTFNGAACSFVLSADDCFPRTKVRGEKLWAGIPSPGLRMRIYKRTAYIRFRPLRGTRRAEFRAALRRFLASRPSSDRPRQWPPLNPYGTTAKAYDRAVSVPQAIGDGPLRS